jgi:hypothetical protein
MTWNSSVSFLMELLLDDTACRGALHAPVWPSRGANGLPLQDRTVPLTGNTPRQSRRISLCIVGGLRRFGLHSTLTTAPCRNPSPALPLYSGGRQTSAFIRAIRQLHAIALPTRWYSCLSCGATFPDEAQTLAEGWERASFHATRSPCRQQLSRKNPDTTRRAAPSPALPGTLSPKGLGERGRQAAALRLARFFSALDCIRSERQSAKEAFDMK